MLALEPIVNQKEQPDQWHGTDKGHGGLQSSSTGIMFNAFRSRSLVESTTRRIHQLYRRSKEEGLAYVTRQES